MVTMHNRFPVAILGSISPVRTVIEAVYQFSACCNYAFRLFQVVSFGVRQLYRKQVEKCTSRNWG